MTCDPIRIIIVDDAVVVRGILSRFVRNEPDIEVISTASNGAEAVEHARNLQPDLMILDIEMPTMDGLTALPLILKASPHTKVIIASTLTQRNAAISLQALELGASDVLQKPDNTMQREAFAQELLAKIRALCGSLQHAIIQPSSNTERRYPALPPQAVAIAASTGGPQALQTIFRKLDGSLKHVPIFLTQHMPATFTTILASNLSVVTSRPVLEATHRQHVMPGSAYVAAGGYHMLCQQEDEHITLLLDQSPPVNFCRPAADPMIHSLSQVYGNRLLLVILTGMGQDGLEGAKLLHKLGGSIIAQDKSSSAVWGMPKVVHEAGLTLATLPLNDIADYIIQSCEKLS